MVSFDSIIGYDNIKRELMQIVDIIKNPHIYVSLGAVTPSGILLNGEPGVGKTMLATAFINECGIKAYVLRRRRPCDDFVNEIREIFDEAKRNAPSIILLDDMDKFVVEEKNNEEYVVLQSCIDEIEGNEVFVIATTNTTEDIPESLLRPGRFDKRLEIHSPNGKDSERIIRHYMSQKPLSDDMNYEDVSKMLSGKTCAELESVINEAAINAGYERKSRIEMSHLISATLKKAYGVTEKHDELSPEQREEIAYHEAGHAVISEVITPGSVGIVSLSSDGGDSKGGFMSRCEDFDRRAYRILVSLGGKAAAELKFGKVASGTTSDLSRAIKDIHISTTKIGTYGLASVNRCPSEALDARQEIVTSAELERYLFKAKEILASNREFLDSMAKALYDRETLLYSDVKAIRERCLIVPAIVA